MLYTCFVCAGLEAFAQRQISIGADKRNPIPHSGADLDRVHRVPEPCQRFQIYQIKGLET